MGQVDVYTASYGAFPRKTLNPLHPKAIADIRDSLCAANNQTPMTVSLSQRQEAKEVLMTSTRSEPTFGRMDTSSIDGVRFVMHHPGISNQYIAQIRTSSKATTV